MDTLCVYFLYKSVENDTLNISLSCVDVLKNIETRFAKSYVQI